MEVMLPGEASPAAMAGCAKRRIERLKSVAMDGVKMDRVKDRVTDRFI
jgi:hypothetical protein